MIPTTIILEVDPTIDPIEIDLIDLVTMIDTKPPLPLPLLLLFAIYISLYPPPALLFSSFHPSIPCLCFV